MDALEDKVDRLSEENITLRERVFLLEGQVFELTQLTKLDAGGQAASGKATEQLVQDVSATPTPTTAPA